MKRRRSHQNMEEGLFPDEQFNKVCADCNTSKPLIEFRKRSTGAYRSMCILCQRAWHREHWKNHPDKEAMKLKNNLKQMYGITVQQYNKMITVQGGVCAICNQTQVRIDPRTKALARLCVDHDHKTGQVRALLCDNCNLTLRFLETRYEMLDSFLQYIDKFSLS